MDEYFSKISEHNSLHVPPKRGVGRPRIFETNQDRIRYHDTLKCERKKLKRFIIMYHELSDSPFEEVKYDFDLFVQKLNGINCVDQEVQKSNK